MVKRRPMWVHLSLPIVFIGCGGSNDWLLRGESFSFERSSTILPPPPPRRHPTATHGSWPPSTAVAASTTALQMVDGKGDVESSNSDSSGNSNMRPLYDGTNYTFPDTTTPAGLAEVLEVSFVNACLQLATGYVDVLKLFIAGCLAAYERDVAMDVLQEALEACPTQTANRPLLAEEVELRRTWIGVVYLTLEAMEYTPPSSSTAAASSGGGGGGASSLSSTTVPHDLRTRYGSKIRLIGEAHRNGRRPSSSVLSVDEIMAHNDDKNEATTDLSPLERAVLMQSLRVATLTPVVLEESQEAMRDVAPPTPPIEGAFE